MPLNVQAAANLDELLAKMPQGEPYMSAWKCWYTVQDHDRIMCSISGGWDSDIMLHLLIRCGAKSKTTFCFFDTGLEYKATKDHLSYLQDLYGIDIKVIRPKMAIPTCCGKYGVPFWSKFASSMIYRLQRHNFCWSDGDFEELLQKYPHCKSALRWRCNNWGDGSRFNIAYTAGLKEFMIQNPPPMHISAKCCDKSKKDPAHAEELAGYDLVCTGIRKYERGARATRFNSCFDQKTVGADYYRPIFWWTDSDKARYTDAFGLKRSDCYEIWGMDRTGCAGCPFGKNFEHELEVMQKHEPNRHKAVMNVFGDSYRYTKAFLDFRETMKVKEEPDNAP